MLALPHRRAYSSTVPANPFAWSRALMLAARQFAERRCLAASAAVAFYAAFALAPTLVVVLAIASMFFGHEAASGHLYAQFSSVMGEDTALALQEMVSNAWRSDDTWIKTLLSIAAIIVGASAIFAQLKESLRDALMPNNPGHTTPEPWFSILEVRFVAVAATIGVSFLFIVFLFADAVLTAAMSFLWPFETGSKILVWAANQFFSTLFLAMLFAWLLRVLPEVRLSRFAIVRAALLGAISFNIGKHLFGLYLAKAATADAFGAAGSLAVMLMWLYFSALVFMFSAQTARAIDLLRTPTTPSSAREAPAKKPS